MKSLLILGLAYSLSITSFAQAKRSNKPLSTKNSRGLVNPAAPGTIRGEITGKPIVDDSIFFVTGDINQKYFNTSIPPAKITNNTFRVEATVNYPQMWRILLKSDKGMIIHRHGEYFIEASASALTTDYLAQECNQVNGATAVEYRNKFIPFFYPAGAGYDCHQRSFDEELLWDEATRFDSTLYSYVQANPASYAALWSLIERFSQFGHSQLREKTLASFTKSVKASHPWQTLQGDMQQALIKQGAIFPTFLVKRVSQPEQLLRLPKAKYTLVDFWFSRCRPCLESFPALKNLYATYQAKGFEIISISTDRTEDVSLWEKQIKDYALPWNQYLDENAVASEKLAVYGFPTTFLLDSTGKVLLRNITPDELEKLLAANLKK